MSAPKPIRRILVALDASPGSMSALKAAAHMAALLEAELLGLYIEDESLLRSVDLPLARLVGSYSGSVRTIERREVEQTLRTQAGRARHALESVAGQARVRWSFRVARGLVDRELVAAAMQADMISLGRCGWSLLETRRMGRTTRAILAQTRSPILLLPQNLRPGSAIVAVYDGTPQSATGLELAVRLAREDTTPLVVVVHHADPQTSVELTAAARAAIGQMDVHRNATFRVIGRLDASTLAAMVGPDGTGILILPEADALLLAQLDVPVLLAR